jgi:hypothetical protein
MFSTARARLAISFGVKSGEPTSEVDLSALLGGHTGDLGIEDLLRGDRREGPDLGLRHWKNSVVPIGIEEAVPDIERRGCEQRDHPPIPQHGLARRREDHRRLEIEPRELRVGLIGVDHQKHAGALGQGGEVGILPPLRIEGGLGDPELAALALRKAGEGVFRQQHQPRRDPGEPP